jgi:Membrane bound O-acyl transferase family
MWGIAFAIFCGCKWLTWRQGRVAGSPDWRNFAYLFLWPGLDARTFLDQHNQPPKPVAIAWTAAAFKILLGTLLLGGLAPLVPASQLLLKGWIGMVGMILLLHFGAFHLLALAWQSRGINALPLMRAPILSVSLADFWGHRWNSAFNHLAHDLIFRPLHRHIGTGTATMAVFLFSGLVHDLVISVPARGGYGLPTAYFLLQGAGLLFERSSIGKRLGLRHGVPGRSFTLALTAIPAFWLFHPAFVTRVIIPFMQVLHAT